MAAHTCNLAGCLGTSLVLLAKDNTIVTVQLDSSPITEHHVTKIIINSYHFFTPKISFPFIDLQNHKSVMGYVAVTVTCASTQHVKKLSVKQSQVTVIKFGYRVGMDMIEIQCTELYNTVCMITHLSIFAPLLWTLAKVEYTVNVSPDSGDLMQKSLQLLRFYSVINGEMTKNYPRKWGLPFSDVRNPHLTHACCSGEIHR